MYTNTDSKIKNFFNGYYVLYVVKGLEHKIVENIIYRLNHNILEDKQTLIARGYIPTEFTLNSIVTDVAFPTSWDNNKNKLLSNLNSYIFIKIESCTFSEELFDLVVHKFFKAVPGVIGFSGTQVDTGLKTTQRYNKNGREVIHYYKKYRIQPARVKPDELISVIKTHNNFSLLNICARCFISGDYVYACRKNKKGKKVKQKCKLLSFKDNKTVLLQSLVCNDKFTWSVDQLEKV